MSTDLTFDIGHAVTDWSADSITLDWGAGATKPSGWSADQVTTDDGVPLAVTSISAQSTQYLIVPVTASSDPTAASVSFAFIGPYNTTDEATTTPVTSSTTFTTGEWQSGQTSSPYYAEILVGPNGTLNLATGTYAVWVKINSSPEIPVLYSGPLLVS